MAVLVIVYLLGFGACAALSRSVKLATIWPYPAVIFVGAAVALLFDMRNGSSLR